MKKGSLNNHSPYNSVTSQNETLPSMLYHTHAWFRILEYNNLRLFKTSCSIRCKAPCRKVQNVSFLKSANGSRNIEVDSDHHSLIWEELLEWPLYTMHPRPPGWARALGGHLPHSLSFGSGCPSSCAPALSRSPCQSSSSGRVGCPSSRAVPGKWWQCGPQGGQPRPCGESTWWWFCLQGRGQRSHLSRDILPCHPITRAKPLGVNRTSSL